jgi:hypothetical protein
MFGNPKVGLDSGGDLPPASGDAQAEQSEAEKGQGAGLGNSLSRD